VTPTNFSDDGVLETRRRFHEASAAFVAPARRPTRGSGLGAAVDMLAEPADDDDEAHPARDNTPIASDSRPNRAVDREAGRWALCADAMADSCVGMEMNGCRENVGAIMGCLCRERG
jgi:hypothetical protein